MKQLLKNWPVLILIIIGLYLLFSSTFNSCSKDRTEQVITQVSTSTLRDQIKDSVNAVHSREKKQAIDSVNALNKKHDIHLQSEIGDLKAQLKAQEENYFSDTTIQNPKCDSIINTSNNIIHRQDSILLLRSERITNLETKIIIQDTEFKAQETSLNNAYVNIDKLKIELNKQNSWWRRNEKWIYFVACAIGTKLLLK